MFAKVSRTENANYIEIATNEDGSINISVLRKHFHNCVGIRYRCKSTGNLRGTRVFDDQLHLPLGVSWNDNVFHCVYEGSSNIVLKHITLNCDIETQQKLQEPDSNISYRMNDKFQLKTFDMIALGLPDDITDESFYRYFSKFGKLTMCELRKNLKKPKSKGYGFLRYGNFDDQNQCIKTEHIIGSATVCLRLPTARMDSSTCKRKVFITNITPSVSQEDILEYFSVFGKIVEIFMPPASNPHAFLTYDSEDSILRIFRFGDSHRVFGGYVVVERVYTKQEMQRKESAARNNLCHTNLHDNEQNFDECFTKSLEGLDYEIPVDKRNEYQNHFDNSFTNQNNSDQTADQCNYHSSQQYQHEDYNYDQQSSDQLSQDQYSNDTYQSQTVHPDQTYTQWHPQFHLGHHKQSYPDYQHHDYYNTDSVYSYQRSDSNCLAELQRLPSNSHQYPSVTNQQFPQKFYENLPINTYQTQSQQLSNQSFPSPSMPHQRYIHQTIPPNPNSINTMPNQESGYSDNSFPLGEPLRNANNSDNDGMPWQVMSDIVYRILEQVSLPNEKDILVKLLVEQLLSPKPNIDSVSASENEVINVEKLIKILQNPNVLDSVMQASEDKLGDLFNRNK